MWVASDYDKWVQVGTYWSTFKRKTGAKISKKSDDYNIYKREPYGNLGQLMIYEEENPQYSLKKVLDFLEVEKSDKY